MIRAVPQGRMLLIDYVCEADEIYKTTDAFYGHRSSGTIWAISAATRKSSARWARSTGG